MEMSCIVYALMLIWSGSEIHHCKARPAGIGRVNGKGWVERMRYAVGQRNGETETQMTAILPDTPFINVRAGLANNAKSMSRNGTQSSRRVLKLRPGQSTALHCEVVAMPSPVAHWTKNGQSVVSSNQVQAGVVEMLANNGRPTLEHAVTVAKLKLNCVTDADAGEYECNGDNGVEKVVLYTKVIVQSDEMDEESCQQEERSAMSPNIFMYTEMRLEYPGNDAQLACRADGQPHPKIRWFNSDNSPIRNAENVTILDNGDLLVKNIDFGSGQPFRQFTCQASNPYGKDSAIIDILAINRSE